MAVKTKKELEEELEQKNLAFEELQKQMLQMQEMVKSLMSQNQIQSQTPQVSNEKVARDELIPVVSLTPHQLNISTEGYGKGDIITFEKYGEVQDIYFDALMKLVQKNKTFFNEGKLYILDQRAVRDLRLDRIYEDLISNETFDKILELTPEQVCDFYEQAPKGQKDIIKDMLIQKKFEGNVNMNILYSLDTKFGLGLVALENPFDIDRDGLMKAK